MKVIRHLDEIPPLERPIALTIGNYDGVHQGHQMILKQLGKQVRKGGSQVVLTFSNHPSTYLSPTSPSPLITSLNHRLKLLAKCGIDLTILLSFDAAFASQSAESFFNKLRAYLPFDQLIVGEDARFGKNRSGDPSVLLKLGIAASYLPKVDHHKEPISSNRIRKALIKGELKSVKKMLGRPYSLLFPFDEGSQIEEESRQYSYTAGAKNLAPLPCGIYAVNLQTETKLLPGVAFYRATRTLEQEIDITCALHFEKRLLPAENLEVTFISYLRKELDPEEVGSSPLSLLNRLQGAPL